LASLSIVQAGSKLRVIFLVFGYEFSKGGIKPEIAHRSETLAEPNNIRARQAADITALRRTQSGCTHQLGCRAYA